MSSVNTVSFLCQSYSFLNNKPKKTLSFGSLSGSLSMGFSRQEYWSGLPFPSPSKNCKLEKVLGIYIFFLNSLQRAVGFVSSGNRLQFREVDVL